MRRGNKIIIIIILVLAIAGLSIGLATFSNVLTISSSATVKPNSGEYKVKIYGLARLPENSDELNTIDGFLSYASDSYGLGDAIGGSVDSAIIDNNNFTISNIHVTFSGSEVTNIAAYSFLILNEGAHDVYLDLAVFENIYVMEPKTCTAWEGASQDFIDEYCGYFSQINNLLTSSYDNAFTEDDYFHSYKIVPGDGIFLQPMIGVASGKLLDIEGEFNVIFDDIKLEFSATDKYAQ